MVLFFYPAAMTAAAPRRPATSATSAAEFAAAGVQRVGISRDAVDKQKQFADLHSFDYPLLSDADGTVAEIFGVKRGRLGQRLGAPVKRWTFAIGTGPHGRQGRSTARQHGRCTPTRRCAALTRADRHG